MKWEEYSEEFKKKFKEKGYSDFQIERYLKYSKKLYDQNLPIILDAEHLSLLVGYKLSYIMGVVNDSSSFYRTFKIKKKNGKLREINEPLPNLKEIQLWINKFILKQLEKENKYITSYKTNTSIRDNAKFHRNQKSVLNIDIKNYFGSISLKKVYKYFISLGYTKSVSYILSCLCCYDESLPQGAPTSPLLSNLVTTILDKRFFGFAQKNKLRYSRYADDITFSGNFNERFVLKVVNKILQENEFEINNGKIRNLKFYQRQEVTGIVVNKKLQIPKKLRNRIRQETYYILKYGLEEHLKRKEIKDSKYLYKLIGLVNFGLFVNSKDEKLKNIKEKLYIYMNDK